MTVTPTARTGSLKETPMSATARAMKAHFEQQRRDRIDQQNRKDADRLAIIQQASAMLPPLKQPMPWSHVWARRARLDHPYGGAQ